MEPTLAGLGPRTVGASNFSDSRSAVGSAALWLFAAAVLCLAFLRLGYGVDFVDEATYVAVPYRFTLGDTPFVDEHTPIQTSGLITLPVIELFHWIRGSTDGLVYFTRVLYLLFCCGVATVVASGLKPWIGARSAVLVSLMCVVFCPLGIPNLSYNTLSSGCFTAGIFLGLRHLLWGNGQWWLFLAGVAHGFAALALPSYVLPNLCYAAAVWALLGSQNRLRGVLLYAAGGVTACAPYAPWLFRIDAETLSNAYFHVSTERGWIARVRQFTEQSWSFIPIKLELGLALALVWVAIKHRLTWLGTIAVSLLPLFPLLLKRSTTSMWYVAVLAGCSTLFLVLAWRTSFSKRLSWSVWFPALCAGGIASVTSLNGLVNSGLGLFPIALVGTSLAVVLVREAAEGSSRPWLGKLDFVFPVLVIVALLGYQRQPFGDDPVTELDTRVTFGPFQGLRTGQEKAAYLRAISDDLADIARDHTRVLFVDHFPAGYLITRMRPAAGCIWTYPCTGGPLDDCLQAMHENIARSEGPELAIFRMHAFPVRRNNMWTCDPNELDPLLEKRFRRKLDRPGYSVFAGT